MLASRRCSRKRKDKERRAGRSQAGAARGVRPGERSKMARSQGTDTEAGRRREAIASRRKEASRDGEEEEES